MAEFPFLGGPWGSSARGAAAPSKAPGTGASSKTPMDSWIDHVGTWNDVIQKQGARQGVPSSGEVLEDWKRIVESWLNIWSGFAPWDWGLPGWPGSRDHASVPTLVFLPDASAECCDPRVIHVPNWIEDARVAATPVRRLGADEPVEPLEVTVNLVEPGQLAIGLQNVFAAPSGDYVSYVYATDGPFRTPLAIAMISKMAGEPASSS